MTGTVLVASLLSLGAACTVDDGDSADVTADNLERLAVGRWRCEGSADGGDQDLLIAIGEDGRLGFVDLETPGMTGDVPGRPAFDLETVRMPSGGTWERNGLKLQLSIPWYGEGAHGFYDWEARGDRSVPSKVEAKPSDDRNQSGNDDTDFRVELHRDRVELVQVRAKSGTISPKWRLTCTKLTSNPGTIPKPESPWTADEGRPDD